VCGKVFPFLCETVLTFLLGGKVFLFLCGTVSTFLLGGKVSPFLCGIFLTFFVVWESASILVWDCFDFFCYVGTCFHSGCQLLSQLTNAGCVGNCQLLRS
jgi:hypothetical protein